MASYPNSKRKKVKSWNYVSNKMILFPFYFLILIPQNTSYTEFWNFGLLFTLNCFWSDQWQVTLTTTFNSISRWPIVLGGLGPLISLSGPVESDRHQLLLWPCVAMVPRADFCWAIIRMLGSYSKDQWMTQTCLKSQACHLPLSFFLEENTALN